jgi:hypothetical protein
MLPHQYLLWSNAVSVQSQPSVKCPVLTTKFLPQSLSCIHFFLVFTARVSVYKILGYRNNCIIAAQIFSPSISCDIFLAFIILHHHISPIIHYCYASDLLVLFSFITNLMCTFTSPSFKINNKYNHSSYVVLGNIKSTLTTCIMYMH